MGRGCTFPADALRGRAAEERAHLEAGAGQGSWHTGLGPVQDPLGGPLMGAGAGAGADAAGALALACSCTEPR